MNTKRVADSILSTWDIMNNAQQANFKFDRTIKAVIYDIPNLNTGEYRVKYEDAIFPVYSSDPTKVYKVKEAVYIQIPQNDMAGKKFIIGSVRGESLTEIQMNQLTNSVIEASPTLDQIYNNPAIKNRFGIIAGDSYDDNYTGQADFIGHKGICSIAKYERTDPHGLLTQYAREYDLLRIKASFFTQFHSKHITGNYGIEVAFYCKGDQEVTYRLDIESFNGSPYRFISPSPQHVLIKVMKDYIIGLKSIKLFQEDFNADEHMGEQNLTIPNIFVQDIEIGFVETVDLTDQPYYCYISAPEGSVIQQITNSIELHAKLFSYGKLITEKDCNYKWFIRDLSISIGSEEYDKNAGIGWKPIENENNSILYIISSSVVHNQQYKVVVTYKDYVGTSEKLVSRIPSQYDFSIVQEAIGQDIILRINNKTNNTSLLADWYIMYPDGRYNQVGQKINSINVSEYLQESSLIFYCAIYDYNGQNIIANASYTINAVQPGEGLVVTYEGEDTFKYDANGSIDPGHIKSIKVHLDWNEQSGINYSITWKVKNNNQLLVPGADPIQLEHSMLKDVSVDKDNILQFNIQRKYRIDYTNNTFILTIRTIDQREYVYEKQIMFLKDGDQGTNGTDFVAMIRPCDNYGNIYDGFRALKYNSSWSNSFPVKCFVTRDGEPINNNSKYNISYQWEYNPEVLSLYKSGNIAINKLIDKKEQQVTVAGTGTANINTSSTNSLERFISIQVTIRYTDDRVRETSIYTTYPIDVIVGNANEEDFFVNMPYSIKYTSSGVNPEYLNSDIYFSYGGLEYHTKDNIESLTTDLIEVINDNYSNEIPQWTALKPIPKFIFKNELDRSNIGLIRCKVDDNLSLIHPIVMYLDTYGNERINGWDGTRLVIDEENGKYIYAPQLGAGTKDSQNRFSGVVLGLLNVDQDKEETGVFGFQHGLNTYGLRDDGTAFFGAAAGGGQIVLDGRYAIIHGGDVTVNSGKPNPATNGMYIVLADRNNGPDSDQQVKGETKAIGIGYNQQEREENFFVRYDGFMSAISGKIANWALEPYRLYYERQAGDDATYVELNTDPTSDYVFWAGRKNPEYAPFYVKKDGTMNASKGTIGGRNGWIIDSGVIKDTHENIILSTTDGLIMKKGSISLGDNFSVDKYGNLIAKNGIYSGEIKSESGEIGGWQITKTSLTNGTVTFSSSGTPINVNNKFTVSSNGTLSATSGNIGGWNFNEDGLKNSTGDVYIYSNGEMYLGDHFSVDSNGAYLSGEINAESGYIGNWEISGDAIINGDTILGSDGTISVKYINLNNGSGWFGRNPGADALGYPTEGVALAGPGNPYVHITNAGASLKYLGSENEIVVTDAGCTIRSGGNKIIVNSTGIHFEGTVEGI